MQDGKARLIRDARRFKAAFSRVEGDELNGWSEAKAARAGGVGTVVKIFDDDTLQLKFRDGVRMDFPFEAFDATFGMGSASSETSDDESEDEAENGRAKYRPQPWGAEEEGQLLRMVEESGGDTRNRMCARNMAWNMAWHMVLFLIA